MSQAKMARFNASPVAAMAFSQKVSWKPQTSAAKSGGTQAVPEVSIE